MTTIKNLSNMKLHQNITKVIVLIAVLAIPFASVPAQAAAIAQENKIEGVIVSRDGDNLVMRSDTGTVTNVTVTKTTKIDMVKGLLGVRSDVVGTAGLVPGLRISVEPEVAGKQTVAKSIQFHVNDLETANDIQAALVVPQQQIQALIEKVRAQDQELAAHKQELAAHKQELAAQKQQNATQDQQIAAGDAALSKRIGDLADYDMKGEVNILFDVNSATLSEKAKEVLQAIAAKAKTFRGYLIQVAGFADSAGSTSHNQNLSDRRAASVATYLQQECDVGISRVLAPIAMGVSKPVAANETAKGRAENRRVTVKIAVNRGMSQ